MTPEDCAEARRVGLALNGLSWTINGGYIGVRRGFAALLRSDDQPQAGRGEGRAGEYGYVLRGAAV